MGLFDFIKDAVAVDPKKVDSEIDRLYTQYEYYWEKYERQREDAEGTFDKALLIIVIPAVGWFITCLDKIGKPSNNLELAVAVCVIVFLLLSLVFNMVSFPVASKNAEFRTKEADENYPQVKRRIMRGDLNATFENTDSPYEKWVGRLNMAVLVTFVLGIVSLFVYIMMMLFQAAK